MSKIFTEFELRIKLIAEIIYCSKRGIIADNCSAKRSRLEEERINTMNKCYSRIRK